MLSDVIIRSTAAFGGTPFRLNKCTALGSAGKGAAVGAAAGGIPVIGAHPFLVVIRSTMNICKH